MAKLKSQKEKDLTELNEKLKTAKSVIMTGYRGTTVKDLDKLRTSLRKENVFSKVYKIPLIKKALEANGVSGTPLDYKEPVILSISEDEEPVAARVIKGLTKDLKTISILQGVLEGKLVDKAYVEALANLPSKDQLRAQFMSVLNGPMAAFARAMNALAEKKGAPAAEAVAEPAAPSEPVAPEATPVAA